MLLEKVSLFRTRRDFFLFILACGFILLYSLLIEFQNYKNLTRFDSHILTATVLSQYTKTKDSKTYQVLKLKSEEGFTFYTGAKKNFHNVQEKKVRLELWTKEISFYQYLTTLYGYSRILEIYNEPTLKQKLNSSVEEQHQNSQISSMYKALFTAMPMQRELYPIFSSLGVSHLFAISGFHLGVLSALLFFLLKYPYKFLQNRYFPYRNSKADLFILIAFILLSYLLFLDSPASLLRSFAMLVIGFVLYDRGVEIISMQTLLLTVILLLTFFPRLVFSLGFWLSVGGVFYIFLFLIHFKHLSKIWQFILVPFWVYLMMLPHSIYIFGNFGIYHPLSVLWTSLFTIFYPLSIVLHITGFGNVFDEPLLWLIHLVQSTEKVAISWHVEIVFVLTSLAAIWSKKIVWILLLLSFLIFIYSLLQLR